MNSATQSLATVGLFHVLGNMFGMILNPPVVMIAAVRIIVALVILAMAGTALGRRNAAMAYRT